MNTYTSLKRSGITSLFAAVLFAAFNSPLHAQGFPTVNCDAPGADLQKAINNGGGGGNGVQIFITGVCDDGPYSIVGKNVRLQGFGPTGATLSSFGSSEVLFVLFATGELRNLTIDAVGSDIGVIIEGSSMELEEVVVQNASGAGIRIDASSYAPIKNSEVNNNGTGISISGSSNAFIHESTIQGNSGAGVVISGNSSATVSNNTIINNNEGVLVHTMSSLFIGGNLIENNVGPGVLITDLYGYLSTGDPVNTIQNNGVDVECQARGIFDSAVAQSSTTSTTLISSGCTVIGTIF